MEPSLDLTAIVTLLGGAQGVLLALSLLGLKQSNRTAMRLLAAFMLISSISIGGSVLQSTKLILVYPDLNQIATPFHFLFAPIMFLYVRVATSGEQRLRRKDLLHFIPSVLCGLYYLPLYLQSREHKLDYITAALQNYPPAEWRIRSLLLACQILPYLVATVWMAQNRRTRDSSSVIARLHLVWVRIFIVMILTTAGVALLRLMFSFRAESMLVVPLCFSIMVYVAGYMALKHPEALTGVDEQTPSKKYEKSNLTSERAEAYLKKLLHEMKTEKPYIEGDLTLQKLADRLSIPVNHLSQVINERLGQNFFDFINSYRVKEAQELLTDSTKKHYTIIAIAEEVGFSSKSAFNAVFKKHVNMTPSEFRKSTSNKG